MERGDMVFFKCSNPAVGVVVKVAKDKSWVDVKWIDVERIHHKAQRCQIKWVEKLNPVLNHWLVEVGICKASYFNILPEQLAKPTKQEDPRTEYYD